MRALPRAQSKRPLARHHTAAAVIRHIPTLQRNTNRQHSRIAPRIQRVNHPPRMRLRIELRLRQPLIVKQRLRHAQIHQSPRGLRPILRPAVSLLPFPSPLAHVERPRIMARTQHLPSRNL